MKVMYVWLILSFVAVLCYCQEIKEDALDKKKDDDKKDPVKKDDDKKDDDKKPDKKPGDNDGPRPQGLLGLLDILNRILRNDCFNDVDCLETAVTFRETARGRLPPILAFLSRIFNGVRDIRRLLFGSDSLERELTDERGITVDLSPLDILNPFSRLGRRRTAPGLRSIDSDILDSSSRLRSNDIGNLPFDFEGLVL